MFDFGAANLKRYALSVAFTQFIWVYSFERVYALAMGLTVTQMVVLEVVYSALILLLDVPTGALADRWGRKPMLIAARVFTIFEFLLIGLATNVWWFLAAYTAAALGHVCHSGTENAFVYDSLLQEDRAGEFERVQGRLGILEEVMTGSGGILGAAIAAYNLRLPYLVTAIWVGLGLVVTFGLREPQVAPEEGDPPQTFKSYWQHMGEALHLALSTRGLRSILLTGAVMGGVFTYADEFNQVYASTAGLPLPLFGFLSAALVGLYALGGAVSYRVRARFGYGRALAAVLVLSTLLLLVASRVQNLGGLALILLFVGLYNLVRILNLGRLHAQVESYRRATVDSAYSVAENLAGIVVGFAFATVVDRTSIYGGYLFLAALVSLYLVYHVLYGRKEVGT